MIIKTIIDVPIIEIREDSRTAYRRRGSFKFSKPVINYPENELSMLRLEPFIGYRREQANYYVAKDGMSVTFELIDLEVISHAT